VMSPGNSGIADPAGFIAPAPTMTLKSERAPVGTFRSLLDPLTAESGAVSNLFDAPAKVTKGAPKPLGSGLFSDLING